MELWSDLHPRQRGADAIDAQLHAERLDPRTRAHRVHEARLDDLPDGAFVLVDGDPCLVLGASLHPWHVAGYRAAAPRPRGRVVELITPPSLVELLRVDREPLVPFVHPSALPR